MFFCEWRYFCPTFFFNKNQFWVLVCKVVMARRIVWKSVLFNRIDIAGACAASLHSAHMCWDHSIMWECGFSPVSWEERWKKRFLKKYSLYEVRKSRKAILVSSILPKNYRMCFLDFCHSLFFDYTIFYGLSFGGKIICYLGELKIFWTLLWPQFWRWMNVLMWIFVSTHSVTYFFFICFSWIWHEPSTLRLVNRK